MGTMRLRLQRGRRERLCIAAVPARAVAPAIAQIGIARQIVPAGGERCERRHIELERSGRSLGAEQRVALLRQGGKQCRAGLYHINPA